MSKRRTLVVGLTGGIAAGKTLASDAFAHLGVPVVDADTEARKAVEPGSEGLKQVVAAFGSGILHPDGSLNRRQLRHHVFSQPARRERLNAILHPLISQQLQARIQACQALYMLIVIPLLCETPRRDWIHRTLVVHADESMRLHRLMRRDGIDRTLARNMLASQCTDTQRLQMAHDIILNQDDKATVTRRVRHLHRFYQSLASIG